MSNSVTHSGTTPRAGGSGRFIGMLAAGLAVVIAVGFAIAIDQGNQDSVSQTGGSGLVIRTNPEDYPTELKRLQAMIASANAVTAKELAGSADALDNRLATQPAQDLGGSADALDNRLAAQPAQDLGGSADAAERRGGPLE